MLQAKHLIYFSLIFKYNLGGGNNPELNPLSGDRCVLYLNPDDVTEMGEFLVVFQKGFEE